jgi:aspartyl-tRNA(Asn)/glutamyl-tRNA(Gln) amidotransferase subunit A
VPFNMSEQPAASINCGYTTGGLPIGLQIAGPRFDDLGVLQVSRAFELIRDAQRPWPEHPPSRSFTAMLTDSLGNPVTLQQPAAWPR